MLSMKIESIKIGPRFRKDLGNIDSLAASLAEFGIFQPVLVTQNGRVLDGVRRIEAAKKLGWSEIQVTIIEAKD